MSKEVKKDYFVGLDIGTGSVGFAVTDTSYKIARVNRRNFIGCRIFKSAETARNRRMARGQRRRLDRTQARIKQLQSFFEKDILAIDPEFFQRLNESRYVPEDKLDTNGNMAKTPYNLFADAKPLFPCKKEYTQYTDKEYHKDFPTIFHLIYWLRTTHDTVIDPRLIYLGLASMMKHRGHFLINGSLNNNDIKNFDPVVKNTFDLIKNEDLGFRELTYDERLINDLKAVLTSPDKFTDKNKALVQILSAKAKSEKEIVKLLAGGNANLSELFQNDTYKDMKLALDADSVELQDTWENVLNENYVVIAALKAMFDWAVLYKLLQDSTYISEAKIKTYKKHGDDLKKLKYIIKTYSPTAYNEMFQVPTGNQKGNTAIYANGNYDAIKKALQALVKDEQTIAKNNVLMKDKETIDSMLQELENGSFLPKQRSAENSIIPYQLYLHEIQAIIANLKDYVPALAAHGEDIIRVFSSHIPYYVGPLNGITKNGKSTNWLVKNADCAEDLHPWNVLEHIDEEATATAFIQRMTKCTYLRTEDVLPKYSLLYSKYTILNEINALKLNGTAITVEQKQTIYKELFETERTVTFSKLKNFLISKKWATKKTAVTGIDEKFSGSLPAFHDFKEKLPHLVLSDDVKEDIILHITLFGESLHIIDKYLTDTYPMLTDNDRKIITSLHYKRWGRLSKCFLSGIIESGKHDDTKMSIIDRMWNTNDNLQQVLSYKYNYGKEIENKEAKADAQVTPNDLLNALNLSPATKRPIKQAIKIMEEIRNVQGHDPKRIFIEMAREKQKSSTTTSRKDQLIALYDKLEKSKKIIFDKDELPKMRALLATVSNAVLRKDKVYLYFLQLGHCMYTKSPIPFDAVINGSDTWDRDHIYPQSILFDDSFDNKVLVYKPENQLKDNEYPIKERIRNDMSEVWRAMLNAKLISQEKYYRLTRSTELNDDEKAGFINRQLVETRQRTKAIAMILKTMFPNTEIVYVKANVVTQFRNEFQMPKMRDINDLHHAKDAYLNIVVGNVYREKFGNNPYKFVQDHKATGYSVKVKKIFHGNTDVHAFDDKEKIVWKQGDNGTIATVKQVMGRWKDVLFTQCTYEATGSLFNVSPLKKGKGQLPLKTSDPRLADINKYGGYNKITKAYFVIVRHKIKGKDVKTIEFIPLYLKNKLKNTHDIESYLSSIGLQSPTVLLKLPMNTLFEINGFRFTVTGHSGKQVCINNATPFFMTPEDEKVLKNALQVTYLVSCEKKKKKDGGDKNKVVLVTSEYATQLGIQSSDLNRAYINICKKLTNPQDLPDSQYYTDTDSFNRIPYSQYFNIAGASLAQLTDTFVNLDKDASMDNKCIILATILPMVQTGAKRIILPQLEQSGKEKPQSKGIRKMNNTIPNKEDTNATRVYVVYQSYTGIKEQKINLNNL